MGGELGGVLGVYLSIPVVATIRIVWVRWQKYSAVIATAGPKDTSQGQRLNKALRD